MANMEKFEDKGFDNQPFEEGFNLKTVLAALFIGFIMLPGSIYLGLIMGVGMGGAASWVTVILFIEIAKRSFIKLKRQEIYIMYIIAAGLIAPGVVMGASGLVLHGGAIGEQIWNQYLVQSPQAKDFGLSPLIPRWITPPAGSEALLKRTFFHRDWLLPLIVLIVHQVLFRLNWFGLGYILFRFTSDVERLPFPMARVQSEGVMALAETSAKSEGWRWRIFSMGSMIGVVFGGLYIVIPTITGVFMVQPLMLLPIPFVDITPKLGVFLPAAMLGLMTDLGTLLVGFVLPFWVVVGQFIGAIAGKVVLNPIFQKMGLLPSWRQGMGVIPTHVTTYVDIWLSVTIGVGVVVALVGIWQVIALSRKKRAGQRSIRQVPEGRGDFSLWLAMLLWLGSTSAYVWLCHILVPGFPWLIFALFGFVLTPLLSYITARMFGITGVASQISFPMVKEGSFILFGKGASIWFAPVPFFNQGRFVQGFKQLELTRTKFTSWVKAEATIFVIMIFCSFLFWSIIWKMAPIPSAAYPYVQKMWPMFAQFKCLWAMSTVEGGSTFMLEAIRLPCISFSALGGLAIFGLIWLLKIPSSLFYGIVGGLAVWPHAAIPMFVGALLGRYYFARRFGKETWRSYTPVLLAGYACGMGLIGMVSIAIALIVKSVSQLVF